MKTKAPRRRVAARAALGALGRGALALVTSPDFGRAAIGALVVSGFLAASWRVKARVLEKPGLQVDRRVLATTPLPRWLSDQARNDLKALPLPSRVSAFEPALVPLLAARLREVPWVEGVGAVRLGFADGPRLRFELQAARPIARLRERGLEVLVARSRRRVPEDRVVPAAAAVPRIEGLPDESSVAREPALEEALALLDALGQRGLVQRLGVQGLELARRGERTDAALLLASGTRVEWGPLAEVPGLKVEERLARLDAFAKRGPPLGQVERLTLVWDDPVYVLKAVATETATSGAAAGGPVAGSRAPR